jgi:type III pantothenate kinase
MLLAIDTGNTQTVLGLFDGTELISHWRVASNAERTSDEYALVVSELLNLEGYDFAEVVTGIAISSTVPALKATLRAMAERWFGVPTLVLEPGVKTGVPILYDDPKEVGADRIANAVAAFDQYGGATIVVDFGTATTFDVVSSKGEYMGGAIAPGIEISLDALVGRAAALRGVELVEPRNVIGRSTIESIQSGALYGYTSLVDGMCVRIEAEVGPCTIVATGGLASVITPLSTKIQHEEPWITLQGLRLIFERNSPSR